MINRIDLKHLRLIQMIASEGSLSKAAKKMFLTQSALSHQLKELEEHLGTPVFHRMNRNLVFTAEGNIMLNSARSILPEFEILERELKKHGSGETGELSISAECYTCYHWLPPILKKFANEYPNIEIRICTENIHKPLDFLRNGKLDLVVTQRTEPDKNIAYKELFTDELVLVIPASHPFSKLEFIKAQDFAGQTLLTHSPKNEEGIVFQKLLNPSNVKVGKLVYVHLTEAVVEMVRAGLGIAVLAKWALKPYLKDHTGLMLKRITPRGFKRKMVCRNFKKAS